MKFKSFLTLAPFLILSLCIHGVALFFLPTPPPSLPTLVPIEVRIDSQKINSKAPQIVSSLNQGKILDELQKNVKRLAELTRQVKEEQIASQIGKTFNASKQQRPTPPALKSRLANDIQKNQSSLALSTTSPYSDWSAHSSRKKDHNSRSVSKKFFTKSELLSASNQFNPQVQISTLSDYIPDVKKGYFTALNTNQYRFYAFYRRINEQIRLRWTENIRQLTDSLSADQFNQLALLPRVTQIELVLNSKGQFVNTFVDLSAGADFLDNLATNALIDSSPFPNPPHEMTDSDGYIRLKYSFHLEWNGRLYSRGN